MGHKILVINPGSTSTKIALYRDEKLVFAETLEHTAEEMEKYSKVADQFEMRKNIVLSFLRENG